MLDTPSLSVGIIEIVDQKRIGGISPRPCHGACALPPRVSCPIGQDQHYSVSRYLMQLEPYTGARLFHATDAKERVDG